MTEVDRGSDRPRGRVVSRFGFWIAIATSATTLLTFVLALTALPNKVPYPFTDDVIADQWPGDYLWMFPAMVLMVLFVALVAVLHVHAPGERKVFSLLALGIAVISAAVLLIDYYIQATVMQLSLEKGQLDGWAIFTQYNPNGVFIALEELGYLLMSLVFLSLVLIFVRGSGVQRAIRGCSWSASRPRCSLSSPCRYSWGSIAATSSKLPSSASCGSRLSAQGRSWQ